MKRPPGTSLFACATLVPMILVGLAAELGGWWCLLAFCASSTVLHLLDRLFPAPLPDAPEGVEFPAADGLLLAIFAGHLVIFALCLNALVTGWGAAPLPTTPLHKDPFTLALSKLALFLACGFVLGQVSVPAAHELIHRRNRLFFRLGQCLYITLLFGHHASAHRLVHHIHVATPQDPNSAPRGMGFWTFLPRAWIGSWKAGLQAEEALRRKAGRPVRHRVYLAYGLGAVLMICMVTLAWGPWGLCAYLGLCAHAQIQLLLADYVQHYGLRRQIRNGRVEPAGPDHSWDACPPASSLWMLNAPRHSDHHAHPARAYPALRIGEITATRPILPRSLPVMATLALCPPMWRRVMDRRLDRLAGPATHTDRR
ncbi:alkane 1-monooxygenase [Thioclava sp. GXIMD4216]|uniref:alkane 1-monooxygenase n=1 Tax=Thioclava sp. GXIMD4216 TaxID=3131929 RepID=UPI0030CAA4DD